MTLARSIVHRGSRMGHDSLPRFHYINISWVLISMQVRIDNPPSEVANKLPKANNIILLIGFEQVISDTYNTVY